MEFKTAVEAAYAHQSDDWFGGVSDHGLRHGFPTQRFASSVAGAEQAHRSLVIYRLNTADYFSGYPFNSRYAAFVRVGFIATAPRPIARVAFQVAAYNGNRRVLDTQGRRVTWVLIALGPFAAGQVGQFVSVDPI